jgi:hypothetical protein
MIERPAQFWELPGPKRYLGGVCRSVYDGAPVLVEDPWDPVGTSATIEHRLRGEGVARVASLSKVEGCCLADALAVATGMRSARPASLTQDPEFRDLVVIAPAAAGVSREWVADLEVFARARRQSGDPRAATLVVVAGPSRQFSLDGTWDMRPTRGLLGSWDTAANAASALAGDSSIGRRLAIAIACQVGAWDLDLVDRLAALPLEKIVCPEETLATWAASEINRWHQKPLSWRHGMIDDWDGEPVPHAMWLVVNDRSLLAKRIWRGQVATLLPWIEETRCQIIALCRRALRPFSDATGAPPADVAALDWGPLLYQLSESRTSIPGWVLRLVGHMRGVRNELAHGRPATWPAIRDCLDASRSWADLLAKAAHGNIQRTYAARRSGCEDSVNLDEKVSPGS